MNEKIAMDELQFIKKIIEDSKASIVYNGKDYIVWGSLVTLGLLLDYSAYVFKLNINFILLLSVIIGLGWIFSFFSYKKRKIECTPKTFSGKILGGVWLATGTAMTIVGFIGIPSGAVPGQSVSAVLSIFLGMAFMIAGFIHNETWMKYLSLGWWIGAVYMFYFPGIHTIFVMALMLLCFQVIPGTYFYQKYKKEVKKNHE